MIGLVNGKVERDAERRRRWGAHTLAAVLALAGATIVVLGGGPHPAATMLPLLVLGGILVAYYGAARLAAGHGDQAPEGPVRARFRLEPMTGDPVFCWYSGEPDTGPRHGEAVRVEGRRRRDGTFHVRRLEVLASPTGPAVRRVRIRTLAASVATAASTTGYALAILAAVWTVVTLLF